MILSTRISRARERSGKSFRALDLQFGFGTDFLRRIVSQGVKAYPTQETVRRLSDFLRISRAEVLLAAAEELGDYTPAEDGRLTRARAGLSEDVVAALETLESALGAD